MPNFVDRIKKAIAEPQLEEDTIESLNAAAEKKKASIQQLQSDIKSTEIRIDQDSENFNQMTEELKNRSEKNTAAIKEEMIPVQNAIEATRSKRQKTKEDTKILLEASKKQMDQSALDAASARDSILRQTDETAEINLSVLAASKAEKQAELKKKTDAALQEAALKKQQLQKKHEETVELENQRRNEIASQIESLKSIFNEQEQKSLDSINRQSANNRLTAEQYETRINALLEKNQARLDAERKKLEILNSRSAAQLQLLANKNQSILTAKRSELAQLNEQEASLKSQYRNLESTLRRTDYQLNSDYSKLASQLKDQEDSASQKLSELEHTLANEQDALAQEQKNYQEAKQRETERTAALLSKISKDNQDYSAHSIQTISDTQSKFTAMYQKQAEDFNALYIQEKEKIDLDLQNYKKETLQIENQLIASRNRLAEERIQNDSEYSRRLSELKEQLVVLQDKSHQNNEICKKRLETLKKQNEDDVNRIEHIIAKNQSDFELKKNMLADSHEKDMEVFSDQETEINEHIRNLNKSIKDTETALEALTASFREQTDDLTKQTQEASDKTASRLTELSAKLKLIVNQREEEKQKNKQILASINARQNELIRSQETLIKNRADKHQARLEELQKQSDARLQELKESHSQSMNSLQAEHNEKVSELEQSRRLMEADYQQQLEDMRNTINADKAAQAAGLQKQEEANQNFTESEKAHNEERNRKITELTASLRSASKDHQEKLSLLSSQIAEAETKIKADYQSQIDKATEQIAALKAQAKDLQDQSDKKDAEFARTKQALLDESREAQNTYIKQIDDSKKQVSDSESELARSREAMEAAIRNDQITVETEKKQIDSLVEKNKDELNKLDIQNAAELNAKNLSIKEFLNNLAENNRQQLQAETDRWLNQEADLNAQMLAEEKKKLLGERAALLSQKDLAQKQYEKKKKSLEDEYVKLQQEASLKDAEHEDNVAALNKQTLEAEQNFKSRSDVLKDNHAATLKQLSLRNADRQSQFNKEIVEIENRIYVLKSSLAAKIQLHSDTLEQLKKEEDGRVEDRQKEIISYQAEFVQIGNAYDDMENSLQQEKADYETQLAALKQQRDKIHEEHVQLLNDKNKHKQEALKQADAEFQKRADLLAEEYLKLVEEARKHYDLEGKTAELNAQKLKLKQNNEKLNMEITEFINQAQKEYEDKVKEHNIRRIKLQNDEKDRLRKHAEDLDQLKKAAAARIAELQNSNARLEQEIAAELQKVTDAQAARDKENAELKLSLEEQENAIRSKIQNMEASLVQIQSEFSQKASDALNAHKQELARYDEAIAAKTLAVQAMQRKLNQSAAAYEKEKIDEQKDIEHEIALLQQEKDNETARISRIIERQKKANDKLLEKKRKIAEKEYREKERAFEDELDNLLNQKKITEDFYNEKYDELQDFLNSRQEVAKQRLEKEASEASKAEETMTLSIEALRNAEAVEENNIRDAHNAEKKSLLAKRAGLEHDLADIKSKSVNDSHDDIASAHENTMDRLNSDSSKASANLYNTSQTLKEQYDQNQKQFEAETLERRKQLDQLKLQEESMKGDAVQKRIDIDNAHRDAIEEQLVAKADLEQDIRDQKERLHQFEESVRDQRRIEKEQSMEINNVYQQKLEGIKRLN